LLSLKNPQKLSQTMFYLLFNKNKYQHYSKISLKRVSYFSEQKMLALYTKIIQDLLYAENNK
jgi:hypothetical protein